MPDPLHSELTTDMVTPPIPAPHIRSHSGSTKHFINRTQSQHVDRKRCSNICSAGIHAFEPIDGFAIRAGCSDVSRRPSPIRSALHSSSFPCGLRASPAGSLSAGDNGISAPGAEQTPSVPLRNACIRACRPQEAPLACSGAWDAPDAACLGKEPKLAHLLPLLPQPAQAHSRSQAGRPAAAPPCGAPGRAPWLPGMRTPTPCPRTEARCSPRARVHTGGSALASPRRNFSSGSGRPRSVLGPGAPGEPEKAPRTAPWTQPSWTGDEEPRPTGQPIRRGERLPAPAPETFSNGED